jgi:hypothetical protein
MVGSSDVGASRAKGDAGQVLVLVLLFMIVFGLILGALLSNAAVNLRNTSTVRNQESKVYAADAGLDWAIQTIRNTKTACPGPASDPVSLGTPSFNGEAATVTCAVTSNSTTTGAAGYALITTDPSADSLQTTGAATPAINGPVYAAGIAGDVNLHVLDGDVSVQQDQCGGQPAGLTVTPSPPYEYRCSPTTGAATAASVPHVLPPNAPPARTAPDPSDCTVFHPGMYSGSITLGPKNYFESGVYVFDDVSINVTEAQVVGGRPGAGEHNAINLAPCADDGPDARGTGVKWVLRGSSSITVGQAGQLELYERKGGDPNVEGTQGISIQSDSTGVVLHEDSGATPALAVHGMIYAPSASIDLETTNGAVAWLLAGVVTGKITLGQDSVSDGVRLTTGTDDNVRQITLTSTAGSGNDARAVATAVITVSNDTTRTVSTLSRRASCVLADTSPCPGT